MERPGSQRTFQAARGENFPRRALLLLAALLAASFALAPRAEAFVYWSHESGITRGGLDGTIINDPLIDESGETGTQPLGVAVDAEHIYWGRPRPSWVYGDYATSIGRANLDGTNIDRSFIPTGLGTPCGVAVNASQIYWVDYAFTGGTIGRADLDGTDVDLDFIPDANPNCDIAVDEQHVYWTGNGLGNIGRANLNGTNVDNAFIPQSAAGQAFGVAVDAGHIYWARIANVFEPNFSSYIGRADLDGTDVDEDFITLPGSYHDAVAVDETHVYWAGNGVGRANLDGTGVNDQFISPPSAYSLAVDALPPNDFSFGKAKKNKRKGIAKLTVSVPGPGDLDLAGTKKVKADDESAEAGGTEKLLVKANGKAGKKLNAKGKLTVNAKVTFSPDGGEPYAESKKITLLER